MKAKWTVALITALMTGAAFAAGSGKAGMETLDANGDGQISQEEAQAHPELAKQFDSLDQDGSGSLERAEFARFETEATTEGGMEGETESGSY